MDGPGDMEGSGAREKSEKGEGDPQRRNGQLSDLRDPGIDFYQGITCREQEVLEPTLGCRIWRNASSEDHETFGLRGNWEGFL